MLNSWNVGTVLVDSAIGRSIEIIGSQIALKLDVAMSLYNNTRLLHEF